jgi:hypothetical protein
MTKLAHASLTAIGRRLHADYAPTVGEPLPSELRDLLSMLAEFEFSKRRSNERSAQVWQPAIAQPKPHS